MTPDQRRAIVLAQEGASLQLAGHNSAEAPEYLRLQIDGLLNALIRVEGAEAASTYAFALADRVCGGLREPTDWRSPALPPSPLPAAEAPRSRWLVVRIFNELASMRPPSNFRWGAYVLGVLHGIILAWMLGALR